MNCGTMKLMNDRVGPGRREFAGAAVVLVLAMSVPGCDSANPAFCDSAEDCEAGLACDLASNTCVSASLTLDPNGWTVDDQGRWWSAAPTPTLRGTLDDPNGPTVQAFVDGVAVGLPALVDGLAWSLTFPEGAIPPGGPPVVIRLVANGRTVEASQVLVGDAAAPALALAPSPVADERADDVEFTVDGNRHDHVGAPVDLAAAGCPDVYKHAYLMTTNPQYATEAAPNPLRYLVDASDQAPARPTLRMVVRPRGGGDLGPALPVPAGAPAADDVTRFTVDLLRDATVGWPALGSTAGEFELEVIATDWAGRESRATWCWNHHPLPAPLEFGPVGDGAMLGWQLTAPTPTPVSALFGDLGTAGAGVLALPVRNHTVEPVLVEIDLGAPTMVTASSLIRRDWIEIEQSLTPHICLRTGSNGVNDTSNWCLDTPIADPADSTFGPTLTPSAWKLQATAAAGPHPTCEVAPPSTAVRCVLPGRAGGEAARDYTMHLGLRLGYLGRAFPAEHQLLGLWFTGYLFEPIPTVDVRCATFTSQNVQGVLTKTCVDTRYYQRVDALDRVTVSSNALLEFRPRVTISDAVEPLVPAYLDAYERVGFTWDGGDDDLPGPH
jgi:hypothetical protein